MVYIHWKQKLTTLQFKVQIAVTSLKINEI